MAEGNGVGHTFGRRSFVDSMTTAEIMTTVESRARARGQERCAGRPLGLRGAGPGVASPTKAPIARSQTLAMYVGSK